MSVRFCLLRDALRWSGPRDRVRHFKGLPHPKEVPLSSCRSKAERLRGGFRRLRGYRMPQIGARHSLDLGYRIEGQIDRCVRLAHCLFIRPAHQAEGLAFLEVDVCGVGAGAKPWSDFLERIKRREKFRLAELALRKATFGLVVGVDEVLHGRPLSGIRRVYA